MQPPVRTLMVATLMLMVIVATILVGRGLANRPHWIVVGDAASLHVGRPVD